VVRHPHAEGPARTKLGNNLSFGKEKLKLKQRCVWVLGLTSSAVPSRGMASRSMWGARKGVRRDSVCHALTLRRWICRRAHARI